MKFTLKLGALVTIVTTALLSHAFAATDFTSTNGDWTDPANWDNGVPTSADIARVGTTLGAGVTPATATLSNHETGAANILTIGRDNGDVGEVDLSNHANLTISSFLQIGLNGGSTGSLIMTNNSTLDFINGNLNVGNDGTGTLEVHGNAVIGDINGPTNLRVGFNTGSLGTALIDGGTVNVNNYVSIGGDNTVVGGQGTLTIKNGGTLNTTDMYVWGIGSGGRSELAVDSTYNLNVGGTLNFNGGILHAVGDGVDFTNPVTLNNVPGPDNNGMHVDVGDGNTLTLDSLLSGNGHLVKDGTGTLILTNEGNLYTGGNIVNNGTFVLAAPEALGDLAAGDLTLNGGTFETTTNMPLHYSEINNFNANGGTLRVQFGGVDGANSDLMEVAGAANLTTNSNLFAHEVSGGFFANGDRVTFIATNLGVNGTFAQLEGDLIPNDFVGLIQPFVDYNLANNSVDAVFGFAASFTSVAKTPNQIATAQALDAALAAGCIVPATNVLGNIPINTLRHAYDLIAPEELASMYEASFAQSMVNSLNLQHRMDDIRWGSTGFCADGFVLQDNHGYTKNDGKSVADKNPEVEQTAPPNYRWGGFITGTGELTKTGDESLNDPGAAGYQLNEAGFTMGVDYRVTDHWAIGLSGGYSHTTGYLVNDGRLNTDGGKMGLYTTWYTGGFYVDASATGGWNNYDTRRTAFQGQETGSTDGAEFDGMVAAGYDWKKGCWTFGPTASFEYTYAEFNSFTESNTSLIPLHYGDQNQEAYRSNLGFRIAHDQVMKPGEGLTVVPELRAAWRHDFGPSSYAIDSNFVGCDDTFTVHGPWIGRDSAVVDLGLTAYCTPGLSAYIFYDGQFGRDNYNNNSISGGFRVAF